MVWLLNEWYTPFICGYNVDPHVTEIYIEVDWGYKCAFFPFYWQNKKIVIIS